MIERWRITVPECQSRLHLEHKQSSMLLPYTFKLHFLCCLSLMSKASGIGCKYALVQPTILDFSGTPKISPPPPHFQLEMLYQDYHFNWIAPKQVLEATLPPPELAGKEEDWGIIEWHIAYSLCNHPTVHCTTPCL